MSAARVHSCQSAGSIKTGANKNSKKRFAEKSKRKITKASTPEQIGHGQGPIRRANSETSIAHQASGIPAAFFLFGRNKRKLWEASASALFFPKSSPKMQSANAKAFQAYWRAACHLAQHMASFRNFKSHRIPIKTALRPSAPAMRRLSLMKLIEYFGLVVCFLLLMIWLL